jgi:hypothetical protein
MTPTAASFYPLQRNFALTILLKHAKRVNIFWKFANEYANHLIASEDRDVPICCYFEAILLLGVQRWSTVFVLFLFNVYVLNFEGLLVRFSD